MNAAFKSPCISSFYFIFFLLVLLALFRLCLSTENNDAVLCLDDERQALLQFKDGLVDEADRLVSWVGEKSDCCKWAGILCDNVTGHVNTIHLSGTCNDNRLDYDSAKEYEEAVKQRLGEYISPSIVHLKQLKHLDLSCNGFNEMQIPNFIGSLGNLRYLNLSISGFGGAIPPQVGNLTELRILCLGNYYHSREYTSLVNIQWLSGLRFLHHLDMSGVDLTKATDWLQVINTLPSLVELHLSSTFLPDINPHVASLNLTSLSLLDLSKNNFKNSLMPSWIFGIPSLVSLDLSLCGLHGPNSSTNFHNLTSLKFLDMSGNEFMSSSLVLKGLSSIASNMILLDISSCGVSSSALDSLHNLTSLLSLDLSHNQLTSTIPKSIGNLCNLRNVDLSFNKFPNISATTLLKSFLECRSPSLEVLLLESSRLSGPLPDQLGRLTKLVNLKLPRNSISGPIPYSIGRLSLLSYLDLGDNLISGQIPSSVGGLFSLVLLDLSKIQLTDTLPETLCQLSKLKTLDLGHNLISGPIPHSVGRLFSLVLLDLSNNQLTGTIPETLGQLSMLKTLYLAHNSLIGVVTDSHFSKLSELKDLYGDGNNLTLRPHQENWIPSFQLESLSLSSWDLGPQFPLWLLSQRGLTGLDISDTKISSTMPESFWRSFPNLQYLNLSQNQIQGRLFDIPEILISVDVSSNLFSGRLPKLFSRSVGGVPFTMSLSFLDLSNNSFTGSLHRLLCPYGGEMLEALNLARNHLTGVIPECWEKWISLSFLNLQNNNLSGEIPTTLGSLSGLRSLNICMNKLSGRLPASLKKLRGLEILQFAENELVGNIPAWMGTELSSLGILNLRSNDFSGNITYELCYLTSIQILDLANNNLSGNIPSCFNNFSVLSMKKPPPFDRFSFPTGFVEMAGSASLVTKGQEHTYSSILELVMVLDLSSNIFSGSIPVELMALQGLQSLNLSNNQLTGRILEHIGDLKLLESFDVSLNHLSGALPASLSRLNFLSSFNVSFNNLTGSIPSSTQLQSFNESSFVGNKLCGVPLTKLCGGVVRQRDQQEGDKSHGADFGLIISILLGFFVGFWGIVVAMCMGRVQSLFRK